MMSIDGDRLILSPWIPIQNCEPEYAKLMLGRLCLSGYTRFRSIPHNTHNEVIRFYKASYAQDGAVAAFSMCPRHELPKLLEFIDNWNERQFRGRGHRTFSYRAAKRSFDKFLSEHFTLIDDLGVWQKIMLLK